MGSLDAFAGEEFGTGFLFGLVALLAGAGLGLLARRVSRFRVPPIAGLLLAAAAVVAFDRSDPLPTGVAFGMVVLGASGLVADLVRAAPVYFPAVAMPGAYILGVTPGLPDEGWVSPVVICAVVVLGSLVATTDRRRRFEGWGPVLFAGTCFGAFVTVPDTEHALVLFGAALPLVLLGWPTPLASLGTGGSYAAVGLLAIVTVHDGAPRPGAIVGALLSLGILLVEPIIPSIRHRRTLLAGGTVMTALAAHAVLVFLVSRIAGFQQRAGSAAFTAAVAFAIALIVLSRADWWPAPAEPDVWRGPPWLLPGRARAGDRDDV